MGTTVVDSRIIFPCSNANTNFHMSVLLSERADESDFCLAADDSTDNAGSWLANVSAPEPAHDSPYFGQVTKRGKAG